MSIVNDVIVVLDSDGVMSVIKGYYRVQQAEKKAGAAANKP